MDYSLRFPGASVGKNLLVNTGDTGLIPGSEGSPGGGNGNPLQYSCLENPMDSPWGCKKSDMTEQLHITTMYQAPS